jgi:cardiolipin synthase
MPHDIWTIPNTLTLPNSLRLLAAPGVAVMFLYFHRPWADWFALALFVGAAITDWFDGYLARLWKQESKFGAMLDPIADKAMVVIAIMVITGYNGMNPWLILPATVILFREVFVSGLREYLGAGPAQGDPAGQVEDHGADGRDRRAVSGNRAGLPERAWRCRA